VRKGNKGWLLLINHLLDDKTPKKAIEEWKRDIYLVMTCLWNIMEQLVYTNLMFLASAKDIWDAICNL